MLQNGTFKVRFRVASTLQQNSELLFSVGKCLHNDIDLDLIIYFTALLLETLFSNVFACLYLYSYESYWIVLSVLNRWYRHITIGYFALSSHSKHFTFFVVKSNSLTVKLLLLFQFSTFFCLANCPFPFSLRLHHPLYLCNGNPTKLKTSLSPLQ